MDLVDEQQNEAQAAVEQPDQQIPVVSDAGNECAVCGERRACNKCETCEQIVCPACMVLSVVLPESGFCSAECRNEAELAAEQGTLCRMIRRFAL